MNSKTVIGAVVLWLALASPLRAHRLEGLVLSSLVEVLPSQIGVEVTLVPGIDIAPQIKALLDRDGDGVFSEIESDAWAELFMSRQSVTVDGRALPLALQSVRASPLEELNGGHAEVVVYYTADLGEFASGQHSITCANRYEPIPCIFQCNGLVPKAPGIRINSHRRDERQQELILAAEFSEPGRAPVPATPASAGLSKGSAVALFWGVVVTAIGALVAAIRRLQLRAADAKI